MTDPRYHHSVPPPPLPASSPSPTTPIPWQHPSTATHVPQAPQPPQAPRRRRVPGWIAAVAAATSVAAVASFLTVLLWPAGGEQDPVDESGPLTFTRFGSVARVDFDNPSHTTLAAVGGDRGYTGWEQGGNLHVIAFDVATGERRWQQRVEGPSQWRRLIAVPGAVLALQSADADDEPRRMFVLDAETGAVRWDRDVRGDDLLTFLDGAFAWLDNGGRALRGLDLATGGERWRHEFPTDEASYAVTVLNESDLARPSDEFGEPAPGVGDHRIVMVNPDRTVWVVDGNTGQIITQASNIADPDDQLLGYGERLYVAANEVDYQLVSYDLARLSPGVAQVHYAPSETDRYPLKLQPCGATRVCLLEAARSDAARADVVAVNAVEGGQIWRTAAEGAERLFGVGDYAVTVASLGFQPTVAVFDQSGNSALDESGLAIRLNDANFMVFTTAGGYEEYVEAIGVPIGGEQVNLGRLPEGQAQENCSWNERYLVCPDRDGAEIWQFAQP